MLHPENYAHWADRAIAFVNDFQAFAGFLPDSMAGPAIFEALQKLKDASPSLGLLLGRLGPAKNGGGMSATGTPDVSQAYLWRDGFFHTVPEYRDQQPFTPVVLPRVQFSRTLGAGSPKMPKYASEDAAGVDLPSALQCFLHPGDRVMIPTGWAIAIPKGFEGQVRPRSGLASKYGVTVANAPGTIDADYRGEIKVILVNHGKMLLPIEFGDRIAQLVIAPVSKADLVEVDHLADTERGANGFGSTGMGDRPANWTGEELSQARVTQ